MTTEGNSAPQIDLEDVLRRLDTARSRLVESLDAFDPLSFDGEGEDGESVKGALERTVDDLNFYYGVLAARALGSTPPACTQRAEFMTLREAVISLQVAHRRFTNLLHDVKPADLEKTASDDHGTYTLKQVLEMAAAQYRLRTKQVRKLAARPATAT